MLLSTHYYVLSLGTERSVLYEAFRDALIRVDNQGFPVEHAIGAPAARLRDDLHAHVRMVDRCFDYYDSRERLGLILVGDEELQSAFDLVTTHGTALIGRVKGDRSQARDGDLGQMVWPVIKEAMSSVVDRGCMTWTAVRATDTWPPGLMRSPRPRLPAPVGCYWWKRISASEGVW